VLVRSWVQGAIVFSEDSRIYADRKTAAQVAWSDVVSLREKLFVRPRAGC